MLKGVGKTATGTTQKVEGVRPLIEHTSETVEMNFPKIYSHELVQIIFEQPYCRISNLVKNDIVKRQTASVHLKQLYDIGVLTQIQSGRGKLFVHPKLVQLMTDDKHPIVTLLQMPRGLRKLTRVAIYKSMLTMTLIFFVASNSKILAQANGGNGGEISLNAIQLLITQNAFINADSLQAIDGQIIKSGPEVDLSSAISQLEAALLDSDKLLDQSCAAEALKDKNTCFV